ncbi:MAG: hypothetical protein M3198_14580 [Actinomycetota bacterium]|nr:hypothetical protein [Actinomycetota bacterium]
MRPPAALGAVCAIAVGLMVVHLQAGVALIVPATAGVLALGVLVRGLIKWPDDGAAEKRILIWTMAAFGIHLLVGLVVTNIPQLRYYLATDSYVYENIAKEIVRHWNEGFPIPKIPTGKEGFYYLLAAIYWVFGAHTAAGLSLNATFASALVPVVANTTDQLFGREAARRVPPLVVLLPSIFLLTSQLMKEAPILLLIACAANGAVRISRRFTPGAVAAMTVPLALLLTFRAWVALVVAQGLVAGIVLAKRELVTAVGTAVSALAVLALLVIPLGVGYSGYRTAITTDLRYANEVRQDLAVSATSGFAADADISTSEGALTYLPRGLVSVSLGPFPWQIRGIRHVPALIDVLVIWALLPSLWLGYRTARRRTGRHLMVIVLPALATLFLLALSIGNFGTITRERMQVLVLLTPLIACGLAERLQRGRQETREPERLPATVPA